MMLCSTICRLHCIKANLSYNIIVCVCVWVRERLHDSFYAMCAGVLRMKAQICFKPITSTNWACSCEYSTMKIWNHYNHLLVDHSDKRCIHIIHQNNIKWYVHLLLLFVADLQPNYLTQFMVEFAGIPAGDWSVIRMYIHRVLFYCM